LQYLSWNEGGVAATVRRDVEGAVRAALAAAGTLHAWAAGQPGRDTFQGRGATFGVRLGEVEAVVRHAHRGGRLAPLLGDRYFGSPRFLSEMERSRRLAELGVATPAVLAGVRYGAPLWHRADVATERVRGTDLVARFFGAALVSEAERLATWSAVGELVRRLHEVGYVHPDLQLRNVLVEGGPGGRQRAWLLDVELCRPARGEHDLARNLARFDRSWARWNARAGARLGEPDRAAFLAAYRRSG
jgi:3-deoxy-D-manno-octulosonic acid kinase